MLGNSLCESVEPERDRIKDKLKQSNEKKRIIEKQKTNNKQNH